MRLRRSVRRVVFWDYNGILLNDLAYVFTGNEMIFRQFGVEPPPLEVWRDHNVTTYPQFYWDHGIPRTVSGVDLNFLLLEQLARLAPPPPFPDAIEVIRMCAAEGVALVVVSGFPREHIVATLERLCLLECFADISGTIAQKTATLQMYLAQLGCASHDALMVGDTVFDAEAAHAAGIASCICPRSGYHPRERIEAARARIPSMAVVEDLYAVVPFIFLGEDP
ncbi:HAD family hydrolase [Candidatus Uhrbacteria bacterium]|nr:HAD family hydrolase [Candidatus Uhrbacteria bacterium]